MIELIQEQADGWYWLDEVYEYAGPEISKLHAEQMLESYCHHWLNGEEFPLPWEEA